jgi:hypothetical protein
MLAAVVDQRKPTPGGAEHAATRFARVERLTREVNDLVRDLNDRAETIDDSAAVIAAYRLERDLSNLRNALLRSEVR